MTPSDRRAGFTLIEIISVLVILGVLAAVAVPKYYDLQDEADKKAALASVAEAQARIQLRFGQLLLQGSTCDEAAKTVSVLSEVSDASEDGGDRFGDYLLAVDGGTITSEGKQASAKRVGSDGELADTGAKLYLPQCGDGASGNGMGAGNAYFNFAPALAGIQNILIDASGSQHTVESNAPANNNNYTDKVHKAFEENGIDPGLSNIKSWAYASNGIMYWSEADIGSANVGDQILTMRYNSNTGTYTVGYITVNSKKSDVTGEQYNSFVNTGNGEKWSEYSDAANGSQSQEMKSSFESAMNYYTSVKKTTDLVIKQ